MNDNASAIPLTHAAVRRPRLWRRLSAFWRTHLIVWSVVALQAIFARTVLFKDFWASVELTVTVEPISFLLVAVLRAVYLRFQFSAKLSIVTTIAVLVLCLVVAFIQGKITYFAAGPIFGTRPQMTPAQNLLVPFLYYYFIFLAWSAGYFWIVARTATQEQRQRAALAEAQALHAELLQLRMQIDPHFLFNALNGIAAEIPANPNAATEMVGELAAFLRHSLDTRYHTLSSLKDELDAVQSYLKIQQARFRDRMDFNLSTPNETLSCDVPCFLIQPLVENAVKHGIQTSSQRLSVSVSTKLENDELTIVVANSGRIVEKNNPGERKGRGLENTQRRLELHYPDRHRITLSESDGTVSITLVLKGRPWSA